MHDRKIHAWAMRMACSTLRRTLQHWRLGSSRGTEVAARAPHQRHITAKEEQRLVPVCPMAPRPPTRWSRQGLASPSCRMPCGARPPFNPSCRSRQRSAGFARLVPRLGDLRPGALSPPTLHHRPARRHAPDASVAHEQRCQLRGSCPGWYTHRARALTAEGRGLVVLIGNGLRAPGQPHSHYAKLNAMSCRSL